jgi:two-component system response regulator HydG
LKHILVIDDDPVFRLMLETFLTKNNFLVTSVGTSSDALRTIKKTLFSLCLVDLRLPDINGLELLKEIKSLTPDLPLILMTSFVDVRTAVKAIKSGAYEYITKPVNTDELIFAIQSALKSENKVSKETASAEDTSFYHYGKSKSSLETLKAIELVAPTNLSVLINGESGTGKEFAARLIHARSKRNNKPFVAIDCGVLSAELGPSELFGHVKGAFTGAGFDKTGHFELADGGSIFLDEIGNLSMEVQVMLLRVIQERQIRRVGAGKSQEIDVRIIAATNDNLKDSVAKGLFREDLYHRLNEFSVSVPSLRERKEDIEGFILKFMKDANKELGKSIEGFSKEAMDIMVKYSWPGNLRELKNVVKKTVLMTDSAGQSVVSPEIIPYELRVSPGISSENTFGGYDLKAASLKQEREYILSVLEKVKYNKSSAARILNIDRKTLYNKLKLFNIEI